MICFRRACEVSFHPNALEWTWYGNASGFGCADWCASGVCGRRLLSTMSSRELFDIRLRPVSCCVAFPPCAGTLCGRGTVNALPCALSPEYRRGPMNDGSSVCSLGNLRSTVAVVGVGAGVRVIVAETSVCTGLLNICRGLGAVLLGCGVFFATDLRLGLDRSVCTRHQDHHRGVKSIKRILPLQHRCGLVALPCQTELLNEITSLKSSDRVGLCTSRTITNPLSLIIHQTNAHFGAKAVPTHPGGGQRLVCIAPPAVQRQVRVRHTRFAQQVLCVFTYSAGKTAHQPQVAARANTQPLITFGKCTGTGPGSLRRELAGRSIGLCYAASITTVAAVPVSLPPAFRRFCYCCFCSWNNHYVRNSKDATNGSVIRNSRLATPLLQKS